MSCYTEQIHLNIKEGKMVRFLKEDQWLSSISQASSANSKRDLWWYRKHFLGELQNKLKAFYKKKCKLDWYSALWDCPSILTGDEVSNLNLPKQSNFRFWVSNTSIFCRDIAEHKCCFSTNSLKCFYKAIWIDLAFQEELPQPVPLAPHTPFYLPAPICCL